MRETMGHFSSKPLTTKYRQDTQETSFLPKAPLFSLPSASTAMITDCLFILSWIIPTTTLFIHPEISSDVALEL